jgi:hypothetical protein
VNREDLDSYRLSADDNERRFRERTIPTYLAGKPARDNPIAAVIVALPPSSAKNYAPSTSLPAPW